MFLSSCENFFKLQPRIEKHLYARVIKVYRRTAVQPDACDNELVR